MKDGLGGGGGGQRKSVTLNGLGGVKQGLTP